MAIDYTEFVLAAQEGIADAGRLISVQKLADTGGDPAQPWDGAGAPTVADSQDNVPAVFVPASGSGLGRDIVHEDLLKQVSEVCMVAPLGVDIEAYDQIVDGGTVLKIEWAVVLKPGPVAVLYVFGVKR